MRAFLIGLAFLIAIVVLVGIGILLSPLLIALGFFLRSIFAFLFLIFAIWLLGKFIIFIWGKLKI
jgi:hypothetical protein